jgi:hypothetical protein
MSLLIDIPKSFTICLIGGDPEITSIQENSLSELSQKYTINFCKRSDSFTGLYPSFSQIVNELAKESTDEFMFFVNPKVNLKPELIEEMLIELCSGFCWTSKIAFGLWGTTKELFRKIGLMDERFIGGEMEDFDFICRLNLFGKAVKWQYITNLYLEERSKIGDLRGLSHTVFRNKWVELDGVLYLDEDYSESKKIKTLNDSSYISNSWMNFSESVFLEYNYCSDWFSKRIEVKKFKKEQIYSNSNIIIKSTSSGIKFEFLCNVDTEINIFIVNSFGYLMTDTVLLKSNTWRGYAFYNKENRPVWIGDLTDYCEIKIFHQGSKIYHNKYVKVHMDVNIEMGLMITKRLND